MRGAGRAKLGCSHLMGSESWAAVKELGLATMIALWKCVIEFLKFET